MISLYASFFLASLLGSWHCAVMCGPIALNMNKNNFETFKYHFGRMISYSFMGGIAGLVGSIIPFSRYPSLKYFFVFILATYLLSVALNENIFKKMLPEKMMLFIARLSKKYFSNPLIFGLLSVLLPCGWLYSFVAAAATTQSPAAGSLVMFLFWLGGLPTLVGLSKLVKIPLSHLHMKERVFARTIVLIAGLYSLFAHTL